jgi:hypothetical protein
MIIFSHHMRCSNTNINDKYGKDKSNTFVFGADTRSGEWIRCSHRFIANGCSIG